MKKSSKILISLISVLLIVVVLIVMFVNGVNSRNAKLGDYSKYAIIGKNNIIVIYEDQLALKIPFDIQVDKNTTYGTLVRQKKYDEVLENLNMNLPEKIDVYRRVNLGNVELEAKNWLNLPTTTIEGKKFILTSYLNSMFKELRQIDIKNADFSDMIVDVLNANGRSGYAKSTGEKLKNTFGVKYNAANYENPGEESYVVINGATNDKVEKMILELDENYFKIKEDSGMPTLANVTFILGKEKSIKTQIEIEGPKESGEKTEKQLKNLNYQNIKIIETASKVDTDTVIYSGEDYFIAYKIGERLGIRTLEKNDDLNNKILIKLK